MKKPEFRIYNSMTRQKEVFEPRVPGKVGMYVCGVTAYDYSHIGHARAYVAFDVLYRYLQHMGYNVNYVRNFTDVDDKIIRKANESGEDPLSLSRRYSEEFRLDMEALQCLPPAKEPLVSDHMDQIINMISQIINNGCAYVVEGDVFFSVDNFPDYGRLSGRKLEDNRAGERVSVDSRKRNPADFALWKSAKPGEPSWNSPWGPGRPGWHIECSAMSVHYLGPAFDIHGGGQDLIFPHHENEIAQSCAACAESNVKYWLHNGFVNVNNDKMSKSLGNFFTIRDVIERYHPLALRYFLMTTHYRSPVNYSLDQLELASDRLFYIYQTLRDCEMALSPFREGEQSGKIKDDVQKCLGKFRSDFQNAMTDDLQTPPVLSSLADLLKSINNNNASLFKARKQPQQQKVAVQNLIALENEVQNVLNILGLMPSSSVVEALQKLKDKALIRAEVTDEEISQQIAIREVARKNKAFKEADDIRARLEEVGIYLMDNTSQGTVWRPSIPPKFQQHQPPQSAAAAAGVP